jgi:hypothetical protein
MIHFFLCGNVQGLLNDLLAEGKRFMAVATTDLHLDLLFAIWVIPLMDDFSYGVSNILPHLIAIEQESPVISTQQECYL